MLLEKLREIAGGGKLQSFGYLLYCHPCLQKPHCFLAAELAVVSLGADTCIAGKLIFDIADADIALQGEVLQCIIISHSTAHGEDQLVIFPGRPGGR